MSAEVQDTVERLRNKINDRIREAEARGDHDRADDWRRGLAEIERSLPKDA